MNESNEKSIAELVVQPGTTHSDTFERIGHFLEAFYLESLQQHLEWYVENTAELNQTEESSSIGIVQ